MLRCSTGAERFISPPSKYVSDVFALSYKRAYGKCVERDTNAFAGTYRHSACNSLSAACAHMQAPTNSLECRHMDACIHACIYECDCSSHQAHAITYIDG